MNTNEQPNLMPPIPADAECLMHIRAEEPGPDGTKCRCLCGEEVTISHDIETHFEATGQWFSCPLCEAAYELRDLPAPGDKDAEVRYADKWLADSIRGLCATRGFSLRQLAKKAGIPQSTFYRRMSGRGSWREGEVDRIFDVLGVERGGTSD